MTAWTMAELRLELLRWIAAGNDPRSWLGLPPDGVTYMLATLQAGEPLVRRTVAGWVLTAAGERVLQAGEPVPRPTAVLPPEPVVPDVPELVDALFDEPRAEPAAARLSLAAAVSAWVIVAAAGALLVVVVAAFLVGAR